MQNLSESVYECTFAVEAHMICDLLDRAGIASRVDGEFLSGGIGELAPGSTVRVRVDPSRAIEARKVIDEWERLQPPPDRGPAPARRPVWLSPLWFVLGAVVGGGLIILASRSPYSSQEVDLDGDGRVDETYSYSGQNLDKIEYDRNEDGRVDARWLYDTEGAPKRYEGDDDFDGIFEWRSDVVRGWMSRNVLDVNRDGRPERIQHFQDGVLRTIDVYDAEGSRVVAREHYDQAARLTARELDRDGDGVFEHRVEYDIYGEPIPHGTADGPG